MTLSDTEVRLIMAALRYTATAYEQIAKISLQRGRRLEAMQQGGFSTRCGELSDRLEKEAKPKPILRAN